MKKFARYFFCAFVFLLPIYFNHSTIDTFEFAKITLVYAFTCLIALVWLADLGKEKKLVISKSPIALFAGLFLLGSLVSLVFSIHPYSSIFGNYWRFNGGVLSLACYIFIAYIAYYFARRDKELFRRVLSFAVYSSALIVFYCFKEYLSNSGITDYRIGGTFGQPNYLGAYLAVLIPFNIALIFDNKKKSAKILIGALLFINIFALILTYSRSAWFGFALSLVVMTYVLGYGKIKKNLRYIVPAILLILLLSVPFYKKISVKTNFNFINEFSSGNYEKGETFYLRYYAWKGGLQIFKNNLMVGTGPETLMYSFPKYRDVAINRNIDWAHRFDKTHNEFIDVLANTGLVGFIPYILFVIFLLSGSFALARRREDFISKAIFPALIAYFATNMLGFSTVALNVVFWLMAGYLVLGYDEKYEKNMKKIFLILISGGVILGVVLLMNVWGRIYLAERAHTRGDNESASQINPNIDIYHGTRALQCLNIGNDSCAVYEAQSAITANKLNPDNYLVAAIVFEKLGMADEVIKSFDTAIAMDQTNPLLHLEKAEYLIRSGIVDDAKIELNKALELKENYKEARDLLISLQ